MKMKKIKKCMAICIAIALVLTSVNMPEFTKQAKAAVTPPAENLKETSVLSAKGEILTSTQTEKVHVKDNEEYDGYIQGLSATKTKADYYKVVFKVAKETAAETEIFTLQPFDSKWQGWDQNIIKFSDAQYDEGNEQYVAYISAKTVKDSLNGGKGGTLNDINISFCQSEPTVTLVNVYACVVVDPEATLTPEEKKWEEEKKVIVWKDPEEKTDFNGHEELQKIMWSDVVSALGSNYSFDKVSQYNVYVYVKITKCSTYSRVKISGGDIASEKISTSNKELIGIENTTNAKNGGTNNPHYIHAGWGTSGGYGSGMGAKETGIYKSDATAIKKGDASTAGILFRRMTTDVEGYICGVTMYSGSSKKIAFSVSEPNDSGKVTFSEGFDETKAESWNKDESDIEPKPEAEMRADEVKAVDKIRKTLTSYNKEDLLDQSLWVNMQNDIATVDELIANESTLSSVIKTQRLILEGYVAKLDAEIDRTATRNGLNSTITYCESLEAKDYANGEKFAKLADGIVAAKSVYEDTSKTRLEYKTARDTLEKIRVALAPNISTEASNPKIFRILEKSAVVKEMGAGINLGNTMDGGLYESSETSWQAYKTTKEYIKALHDAGYNTVRIPITWGAHINEDYTIDEAWISRVQEIVDYCVDQDMYAIINIHHDGAANHDDRGNNTPACWLDTYQQDIETVYQKFQGVWKTLANRFKDYDEHLIFESMNEVTDAHGTATNEDDAVLSALNQLFINTVRATGSNNVKRWLAITGRFATTSGITEMPEDVLADKGEKETTRLMFAVHIYKNNSNTRWSYNQLKDWQGSLSNSIKAVQKLDANMPLYVGEYGVRTQSQYGSATNYNNAERALNYELCAAVCDSYGAVPVVWDQGTGNYVTVATETGLFTDWNRPALKPVYDDVVFGTIRGTLESGKSSDLGTRMSTIYKSYGHSTTDDNSISKDPEITEATEIEISETKVQMEAGSWKTITATTDSSRDIVLWKTADDSIATVYNGKIHAKASGITTVYATSQSGSVEKEIQVIVQGTGKETATAVKTNKAYFEITEGETADIITSLTPADSTDSITYTSSNTDVATVSSSGKITGENPGQTYVIVKAASGVSTIVAVKVNKKSTSGTVGVTLNALYASNGLTEKSQPLTITGDGQYTITLDLEKDLSEAGKKAGITKLEELTAIYLRDTNTLKPVVSQAYIRYDKVVVNDTELTLKKTSKMDEDGFQNLLKESGQLDSNDPINGWDGNAVEEVTVKSSNHSVSFSTVSNPTRISLTFTIKDMKFFPTKEKQNEVTKITSKTQSKIVIPEVGETAEIELNMTPIDTDSEITFYSTDSSVAVVNGIKLTVDEDGNVKIPVTAMADGTATIVGITENGMKVFYMIGVGSDLSLDDLEEPTDPTPDGLDGTVQEPEQTPVPTEKPGTDVTPVPTEKPGADVTPVPTKNPGADVTPVPTKNPGADVTPVPTKNPGVNVTPVPTKAPGVNVISGKTQLITAPAVISKAINAKAFNIGAKSNGNGKLTYKSSNTKVATINAKGVVKVKAYGTAKIIITASATATYKQAQKVCKLTVTPKAVKIKSAKRAKSGKKLTIKWKKDKTVKGYQVVYATDKNFKKGVKKITINKNKTVSKTISKKISKNKMYYVKVRSYAKVGSKKIYGPYSKTKKVSVKK